ncbi:MAG: hypothetical protein PHT64_00175 [Bacteroidales bacterium]|nr:hypothetical protein [Bacteroidales bacterium]MDD3521627.1 hypothetical protein [Bacteroidales bacterium]MDD4030961.1 hypothetical protein [Bacteroidales bacterium]MDD4436098.1 hypothetical protein [Bacteroidales bacterium]MDD5732197.1 hypothetical protein [Bacteroidales bacterium]
MSENKLYDPHLKENPFGVPPGYFEQVESRWAQKVVDAQQGLSPEGYNVPGAMTVAETRSRRLIRLLKPQMQLAAAFVLLFGIGSLMLMITTRNRGSETQSPEFSLIGELSDWGVDHHVISELVLNDLPQEESTYDLKDLDLDELIDYLNYPSLDLADLENNTNNE